MRISYLLRLLALLLTCSVTTNAVSQQIYRWVDEQGSVHFGTIPPPKKQLDKVEVAGSSPFSKKEITADESATVRALHGHWIGTRFGKPIEWVLERDGRFVEAYFETRSGYTKQSYRTFAGRWTVQARNLLFEVKLRENEAEHVSELQRAAIIKLEAEEMELDFGGESETFKRDLSNSQPAIPEGI